MARTKKKTFEEEKVEWNVTLSELIANVEKSYEKHSIKEKYDFVTGLISAQNDLK